MEPEVLKKMLICFGVLGLIPAVLYYFIILRTNRMRIRMQLINKKQKKITKIKRPDMQKRQEKEMSLCRDCFGIQPDTTY